MVMLLLLTLVLLFIEQVQPEHEPVQGAPGGPVLPAGHGPTPLHSQGGRGEDRARPLQPCHSRDHHSAEGFVHLSPLALSFL